MTAETATETRQQCACSLDCTATTRGTFAPGHDARMVSRLAKAVIADQMKLPEALEEAEQRGGSQHLLDRIAAIVDKHMVKVENVRQARQLAKSKPAVGTSIKVPHGKRKFNAEVVEQEPYGPIARHHIKGAGWCYHDTATGDQLEI